MRYDNSQELKIPDRWDELGIPEAIQLYKDRPPVLEHLVQSLMARFITGQDIKTVQRRTALLEAWMGALSSQGRYYSVMRSLKRLRDKEEIRDLEMQIQKDQLLAKKDGQPELSRLDHEIEKEKKVIELARLRRDFEAEAQKAPPPRKMTEDDIKMEQAEERDRRDVKFKVRSTVLKGVTTIAEIQKAEDEETDRILGDRSLTPSQQRERLKQLHHDCDEAKQRIRTGTAIFEDE